MARNTNLYRKVEQLVTDGKLYFGIDTEALKELYGWCCKTWKVKDSTTKQLRKWGSGPNEDFKTFSQVANDLVYGEDMDLATYKMYGKRLVEIAINAARWQSRSVSSPYYVSPRIIVAFLARCREINKEKYREEYTWFVTRFAPENVAKVEDEGRLTNRGPYSLLWDPKYKPLLLRFAGMRQVDHPMCIEFARALEWAKDTANKMTRARLELSDEMCSTIMNRVPPGLYKHVLVAIMILGAEKEFSEIVKTAKDLAANNALQNTVNAMIVFP